MTWTRGANGWLGWVAGVLLCCAVSGTASGEDGGQLQSGDGTVPQQAPQPSQDYQGPSGYQMPQSYQLPQLDQPGLLPGNVTAQSLNVTPQGIGAATGPMMTSGLVAYKPIPESLLPGVVSSTVPVAGTQSANVPTQTNLGAPAINWGPYTLGPDDVVLIAVRNQPEFTGTYVIGRDGMIQFGFIGDVKADGLTKEELAREVETRLKRYVRVPSVYVTIVGFNSKAIYILGLVQSPGKYAMRGDSVKIRDAVIAAGLVLQNAKLRKVYIIKSDPTDPTHRMVNLHDVLFKGKTKDNIDLVHGDIVVVPTTTWGVVNDFLGGLLNGGAAKAGRVAALAAL